MSDSSPRVLVVYTRQHAQTKTIALAIGDQLSRVGIRVELADADSDWIPSVSDCDAVVIGSSLRFGRHPSSVIDYVQGVRDRLAKMPAFFFSIDRDDNGGIFEATGWRPTHSAVFDRRLLDRRRFRHILGGHAPSPTELATVDSDKVAVFAAVISAAVGHQRRIDCAIT